MRTPLIAGNWKMNMTVGNALELVKGIHFGLRHPGEVDVVVAPPFTALHPVAQFLKDSYIGVAGQSMHWEDSGAFTAEVSGGFLRDVGAQWVILGHSERRQYFGETDETVNRRLKSALRHGLTPIVCVGETLQQREACEVARVIATQVIAGLIGLTALEVAGLVIAYEPVWAIGTGRTASAQQAQEVHAMIRSILASEYRDAAPKTRILYGGSMKPSNSAELLSLPDVDGGLIGGASLKPSDFISIIKNTSR